MAKTIHAAINFAEQRGTYTTYCGLSVDGKVLGRFGGPFVNCKRCLSVANRKIKDAIEKSKAGAK